MTRSEDEDSATYTVVINGEEQYSIWPAEKPLPLGWRPAGKIGRKTDCLEFVAHVWTDMRPKSLRDKMEQDRDAQRSDS